MKKEKLKILNNFVQNNMFMSGETNLKTILQTLSPILNDGEFVYCTVPDFDLVPVQQIIFMFRENEEVTIVLRKEDALQLNLTFSYIAAWITLEVNSSLSAVGLTAAFSQALSKEGISCNVVAAFHHDHIFVDVTDREKAMIALQNLQLQ